jgi:hypothetical protein
MDSFIFYGDYAKSIQVDNLQQTIGADLTILDSIQKAAVEECMSYLKQKYDVSQAFQPITQHDKTKTYKAGQTVYLNAAAYSATSNYALGVMVLQAGSVYVCTTAIIAHEAFTAAHWTLIGLQYSIYYAAFPNDVFDYQTIYAVGDQVFWKDKVYTCRIATSILDHEAMLQIGQSGINQIRNIFPNDATSGSQYWGSGVAYSVAVNTAITDTKWTLGDNRDQKLLEVCINIVLYKAHLRISPRNVPELRVIQYMGNAEDREIRGQRVLYPTYCSLGWLQAAAIGDDITPSLPILQPLQGSRIRFGGNQKLINSY